MSNLKDNLVKIREKLDSDNTQPSGGGVLEEVKKIRQVLDTDNTYSGGGGLAEEITAIRELVEDGKGGGSSGPITILDTDVELVFMQEDPDSNFTNVYRILMPADKNARVGLIPDNLSSLHVTLDGNTYVLPKSHGEYADGDYVEPSEYNCDYYKSYGPTWQTTPEVTQDGNITTIEWTNEIPIDITSGVLYTGGLLGYASPGIVDGSRLVHHIKIEQFDALSATNWIYNEAGRIDEIDMPLTREPACIYGLSPGEIYYTQTYVSVPNLYGEIKITGIASVVPSGAIFKTYYARDISAYESSDGRTKLMIGSSALSRKGVGTIYLAGLYPNCPIFIQTTGVSRAPNSVTAAISGETFSGFIAVYTSEYIAIVVTQPPAEGSRVIFTVAY